MAKANGNKAAAEKFAQDVQIDPALIQAFVQMIVFIIGLFKKPAVQQAVEKTKAATCPCPQHLKDEATSLKELAGAAFVKAAVHEHCLCECCDDDADGD